MEQTHNSLISFIIEYEKVLLSSYHTIQIATFFKLKILQTIQMLVVQRLDKPTDPRNSI